MFISMHLILGWAFFCMNYCNNGSPFPEDVWAWWLYALTPASVHSLWSSSKCLNRLCLTVFSSLRSSLLLVHILLHNFFITVNFAFNMLWYSTPWTATPSVMTLCSGCQWSSSVLLPSQQSSQLCDFKEQEIPRMYTVWMVIYWNSNLNIIIFWQYDFWLSLAVSSNHQN